jgi:hypothetical protein
MDAARFRHIARQLPELLDEQMKAVAECGLDSLSKSERAAYAERKKKILQLRGELEQRGKPK